MPGAMAFTRTPIFAPCTAAQRVRPTTPCLDVWYGMRSSLPRRLPIDAVVTTLPPVPWRAYWRNAARSPRNTPRRLTPMTASKSSTVSSSKGASEPGMPALRWWRSMLPKRLAVASTTPSTSVLGGDVRGERERRAGQRGRELLRRPAVEVDDRDRRALLRQPARGGRADAARAAGDQRDLPLQTQCRHRTPCSQRRAPQGIGSCHSSRHDHRPLPRCARVRGGIGSP